MNTIHPVIAAALAPFAPVQSDVHLPRYQYGNLTYICKRTMQEDIDRDRAALQKQINRFQTVEGFFI